MESGDRPPGRGWEAIMVEFRWAISIIGFCLAVVRIARTFRQGSGRDEKCRDAGVSDRQEHAVGVLMGS